MKNFQTTVHRLCLCVLSLRFLYIPIHIHEAYKENKNLTGKKSPQIAENSVQRNQEKNTCYADAETCRVNRKGKVSFSQSVQDTD